MRIKLFAALVIACSLIGVSFASAYDAATYYPLQAGDSSIFQAGEMAIEQQVSPEEVLVGEIYMRTMRTTIVRGNEWTQSYSWETADANGVRTHAQQLADTTQLLWSPPLKAINGTFEIGDSVSTTSEMKYLGPNPAPSNYCEHVSEVVRETRVTVLAGTFEAIELHSLITCYEYEDGPQTYTIEKQTWLSPGLGMVMQVLPNTPVVELVETNRTYLPEPTTAALHGAASLTLLGLAARRFI